MLHLTFIGMFGACVGSLTSMLIYRLPLINLEKKSDISLFFPRSSCPNCKKQLTNLMLIPVLSFIWQKGICGFCRKKIKFSYLINEITHIFVAILTAFYFGVTIEGLLFYMIFFILFILFFLDLKFLYLPFFLNLSLLPIGLLTNYLFTTFTSLYFSFLGMVIGYAFLWLVNAAYKILNSRDGIGGGDFILLAGLGSIFGIFSLGPILLIGSSISICIYFIYNEHNKKEIPFGSGLILGAILYYILKIIF